MTASDIEGTFYMCWSEGASLAMVGLGGAAAIVTFRRGEPAAITATLGFFAVMEALQAGGYWVIDECSLTSNQTITLFSYLHIALQPIFINAFAMSVAPMVVSPGMKRAVYALAFGATLLILLRLIPLEWAASCRPGTALCGPAFCTVSGSWHLAWEMPLNDYWRSLSWPLADALPFPAYFLSVFILPLLYGAWRLVVFHALLGPVLAMTLTDNPNEMPAIWCLFSVGLVLLGLSPLVRTRVLGERKAA